MPSFPDPGPVIAPLSRSDTAFAPLAGLWFETFFLDDGADRDRMTGFLGDLLDRSDALQTGFKAMSGDQPVGMVLVAHREIDQMHDRTPWLAGFVVDPAHRRCGIGRALVRHVETHVAGQGLDAVWLYTYQAEAYYLGLGWTVEDRFDWHDGTPFALMRRRLDPKRERRT